MFWKIMTFVLLVPALTPVFYNSDEVKEKINSYFKGEKRLEYLEREVKQRSDLIADMKEKRASEERRQYVGNYKLKDAQVEIMRITKIVKDLRKEKASWKNVELNYCEVRGEPEPAEKVIYPLYTQSERYYGGKLPPPTRSSFFSLDVSEQHKILPFLMKYNKNPLACRETCFLYGLRQMEADP